MVRSIVKEAVRDALILSVLVIVPIAFLGPGWQTSSTWDRHGKFSEQHQQSSIPGETNEDGSSTGPQIDEKPRKDRDIPLLRAFATEREVESTRSK
jgi:hypothetical protein